MTSTGDDHSEPGPLSGRRILLTGATGFIGGHVADLLHRSGAEVHGLARSQDPATTLGTPVTWHRADVADGAAVDAAVARSRPHQIVHLASLVQGSRDPDLIVPMFLANTASTVNLLDAARRHGIERIHLAGSLEEPTESDHVASSPYAVAKAASRLYGRYYDHATDLEVINLQIFMVYGPAQRDDTKLIPYVINTLLAGESPTIGSGRRPVDWVYVADVAETVLRCCLIEKRPDRPVPVGTGSLATVGEVVDRLTALVGGSASAAFGARDDRRDEVVRAADIELTTAMLGWHPTITLDDGLARTLDWYRNRASAPS